MAGIGAGASGPASWTGGGCCLVRAAAAITRSFRADGGGTAVAVASRAAASRRPAISCMHSSHSARCRSNLARSGAEIASIA